MFISTSSISMIGYVTLGVCLFISLILALNNVLPEVGFVGVMFGLIIIFSYITLQSWVITLSLIATATLFILLKFKLKNGTWKNLTLVGMVFIFCIIFVAEENQSLPKVMEDNIQSTMKQMENHAEVNKAAIEIKEDTIHCTLEVSNSLSEVDKKTLGEKCAKVLASEAAENNSLKEPRKEYLGELYDYYIIELMIGTDGHEDEIIFKRKYTNSAHFAW